MNTEEFIKRSKEKHGDKFDYSESEYKGTKIDIAVICRKHGKFYTRLYNHMNGAGCRKCADEANALKYKKTGEDFIKSAIKTHGNKYDYSKVEYVNWKTKVCVICPEHGEFWQLPNSHISGNGCPKCALIVRGIKKRSNTEDFITKSKQIHGDKYDYSKTEYLKSDVHVEIKCNKCGEVFLITPENHLGGKGCHKCKRSKLEIKIHNFLIDNDIKHEEQKTFKWLGR